MANSRGDEEDWTLLMFIGAGFLVFAPTSLLLAPVRAWAINVGIFATGDSVLLPLWDGAGLDVWRLVIAAAIVILVIAMIVGAVRMQSKNKGSRRV